MKLFKIKNNTDKPCIILYSTYDKKKGIEFFNTKLPAGLELELESHNTPASGQNIDITEVKRRK